MQDQSGLFTTTVLNSKRNQNTRRSLVKKTDYNAKISDIEENTLLFLIIIDL